MARQASIAGSRVGAVEREEGLREAGREGEGVSIGVERSWLGEREVGEVLRGYRGWWRGEVGRGEGGGTAVMEKGGWG